MADLNGQHVDHLNANSALRDLASVASGFASTLSLVAESDDFFGDELFAEQWQRDLDEFNAALDAVP